MHKLWRFGIVIALITTACRAEANLDLVIAEDGSGSYTSEVGLDEELREVLSTFGDPDELLSALDFGVPGANTSERVDGDMTFVVVTSDFDDVAELASTIRNSVEGNPFERFEIIVDEDGARVDAAIEFPEQITGALQEAENFADQLEATITVRITLPGRIVSSNADATVGDELVWNVSLSEPEVVIQAESTLKENGFPLWIIVLLFLVGGVLAAWWLWSRRQEQAAIASIEAAQAADRLEP